MGLIASYNLRSMTVRKGTAAMTAMGIAMVVAVFVMTMAIAQGFNGALVASGSNENAILLRKGATSETVSGVLRSQLPLIEAMPQVARAPDGHVLASPELVVIIALPRVSDNQPANVPARGVGPDATPHVGFHQEGRTNHDSSRAPHCDDRRRVRRNRCSRRG
jgi:hypothetical protein